MSGPVTLCVLLWAVEGRIREMAEYEEEALALIAQHGGLVLNRLRNTTVDDGPVPAESIGVRLVDLPRRFATDLNDRPHAESNPRSGRRKRAEFAVAAVDSWQSMGIGNPPHAPNRPDRTINRIPVAGDP
jgi:hypothetical protein